MRVAVVGAGIAGLRTAQSLERLGADVTVIEARHRVGGRLWTTKVGGQEFEAGAEWIDAEHRRVFALLEELGMKAVQADPRPRRLFFCGKELGHVLFRPLDESVDESLIGRGASLAEYLDDATKCASPFLRPYLEAVVLSDEGNDSDRVGLDEWLRFVEHYSGRDDSAEEMSAFRFPVSATKLCEEIAGSLRREVRLGTSVESVTVENSVRLGLSFGLSESFDEVVLTPPPACLENLRYDGPRVWEGVEMTPTCKIALLFDRPFWEDAGWSGHLMSDLAVQQVWPSGSALVCYVNGRGMERIVKEPDPIAAALDSLATFAPEARGHFLTGGLIDWRADPQSGGGFPFVPPGKSRPALQSNGPVRFAGDWSADWMGFVEGALESAERVVEEIKIERGLS